MDKLVNMFYSMRQWSENQTMFCNNPTPSGGGSDCSGRWSSCSQQHIFDRPPTYQRLQLHYVDYLEALYPQLIFVSDHCNRLCMVIRLME